jgi:hypothetical protein
VCLSFAESNLVISASISLGTRGWSPLDILANCCLLQILTNQEDQTNCFRLLWFCSFVQAAEVRNSNVTKFRQINPDPELNL